MHVLGEMLMKTAPQPQAGKIVTTYKSYLATRGHTGMWN